MDTLFLSINQHGSASLARLLLSALALAALVPEIQASRVENAFSCADAEVSVVHGQNGLVRSVTFTQKSAFGPVVTSWPAYKFFSLGYRGFDSAPLVFYGTDCKIVYMLIGFSSTSYCLYRVNPATAEVSFLLDSVEDLIVVPAGKWKGKIAVQLRKSTLVSMYHWYWLYTGTGKLIGPIGSTAEMDTLRADWDRELIQQKR